MKKTQIDRAIESIEAEIATLLAMKARLVATQAKLTPRRPRAVKKAEATA